VIVLCELL